MASLAFTIAHLSNPRVVEKGYVIFDMAMYIRESEEAASKVGQDDDDGEPEVAWVLARYYPRDPEFEVGDDGELYGMVACIVCVSPSLSLLDNQLLICTFSFPVQNPLPCFVVSLEPK